MADKRYAYKKVNVIKVLVENSEGKILLVKEPETNEWMPGHWSLPGGKPLEKESLVEAFDRKMEEELGLELEIEGLLEIEELLIEERTVLMFHVVVRVGKEVELKGEADEYRWAGKDEINEMPVEVFTEFFNKKLILRYLSKDLDLVDIKLINSHKYYEMGENPDYKKWFESGKK